MKCVPRSEGKSRPSAYWRTTRVVRPCMKQVTPMEKLTFPFVAPDGFVGSTVHVCNPKPRTEAPQRKRYSCPSAIAHGFFPASRHPLVPHASGAVCFPGAARRRAATGGAPWPRVVQPLASAFPGAQI
jgi:hypothetical protein